MQPSKRNLSRRHVLGGLAATLAAGLSPHVMVGEKAKSKVVRVESAVVWEGEKRDPQVVQEMVHKGLLELTGQKTPEAAWQSIFRPGMKVGLKINLLGRPWVYTAPEITDVVAAGAIAAGIKPENLIIWDRYIDHFRQTSYHLGKHVSGGTVLAGGEYADGYEANTLIGPAAMDTVAARATQVTVNLPVLKDHNNAGITASLKNIAFGCYRHPGPAHENCCDPYIVDAYSHFLRYNRVPLIILDATKACFEGGPNSGNPRNHWKENAIYLAFDPVALDQIAMQRIMLKRREMNLSDKSAICRHIATAAARGLGTNDPALIGLSIIRL